MIQSTGSVASLLSGVYQDNSASLSKSLQRISTGKRVVDASDDMGSYLKASTYTSAVNSFNSEIKALQTGKGYADAAKAVTNTVVSSLQKLKDLATQYAATSAADLTTLAGLNQQYNQVATGLTRALADGKYAGTAVHTSVSLYTAAGFNVGSASNITEATVVAATNAATLAATIDLELNKATKFVTDMSTISDTLNDAIKMRTSIIQSYQGAISSLTDVNEAEEQLNVTNNQVRMQATAAMMSQANTAAAAIARLFQ
jgi:flagellin